MSTAPASKPNSPADKKQLILVGGGAAVVLVLLAGALFVMRRRSSRRNKVADTAPPALEPVTPPAAELPQPAETAETELERKQGDAAILGRIKLPEATKTTEVLIRHVRETAGKDPATAANVLRAWMAEPAGKSGA
jgi:flagellar biosynthesis/type III secretory pathway M-ring protein FliF/YscJ